MLVWIQTCVLVAPSLQMPFSQSLIYHEETSLPLRLSGDRSCFCCNTGLLQSLLFPFELIPLLNPYLLLSNACKTKMPCYRVLSSCYRSNIIVIVLLSSTISCFHLSSCVIMPF